MNSQLDIFPLMHLTNLNLLALWWFVWSGSHTNLHLQIDRLDRTQPLHVMPGWHLACSLYHTYSCCMICHTTLKNDTLGMRSSVVFWNFLIYLSAFVPSQKCQTLFFSVIFITIPTWSVLSCFPDWDQVEGWPKDGGGTKTFPPSIALCHMEDLVQAIPWDGKYLK